jgi:SPW repeat
MEIAMGEQELRKREARLTARETYLMRRERDLASREAELADGALDDSTMAALGWLTQGPRDSLRHRITILMQIAFGLWLMVAPLALGYAPDDPRAATVVCGAAFALLGLWRLAGPAATVEIALWLAAGVATTLVAVATLADKSLVAAVDDAAGGVAVWLVLLGGWPRATARPLKEARSPQDRAS